MGHRKTISRSRLPARFSLPNHIFTTFLFFLAALVYTVAPSGQAQQPETIYELIYAFDHTFSSILTEQENLQYRKRSPEELKENAPDTYEKVSQNVVRWTDDWIEYIAHTLETIPPERLAAAQQEAESINRVLRDFFDSKGWSYKPLEVVFLPQRVFHDERMRHSQTRGLVIPFYPGAFFASVDPSSPMEIVLVHETLHFNKRGRRFGGRLREGITQVGARYIVLKYDLLPKAALRRDEFYVDERKRIDVILNQMIERTGMSREGATELLLEAYLTGNQDKMYAIFGEVPWERVLELANSKRWYKSDILRALTQTAADDDAS